MEMLQPMINRVREFDMQQGELICAEAERKIDKMPLKEVSGFRSAFNPM